jgi:uncharacterized protein DUF695
VPFWRRTSQTGSASAIADFWTWWSGARNRIQATIEAGDAASLADEVNQRVDAIHSDLQWEFARGARSRHALVVSPAGNANVRAAAARWLAEAPGPDAIWEYHRSRQADPGALAATFEAGGHRLDLDDLRFAFTVETDRKCVDVTAYHPGFGRIPEGLQAQITFLALDWLLGEEAVEIWVGAVNWSTTPIADQQAPAALGAAVAELAMPRAEPMWTLASGRDASGAPIVASMQLPLRSARWPQYDTHVAVMLPYRNANDGGLPVDDSLEALRDFEDRLTEQLDVHAQLVAHESSRGRRILHYYVDGAGDGVRLIEKSLPDWREGKATAKHTYDPGFNGVAHLS